MTCPGCQAELDERTVGGIQVDICVACGGIWFDRDELAIYRSKLAFRTPEQKTEFVAAAAQKNKPCPRCRVLTLRYGSLESLRLFQCSNCEGIFMTRAVVTGLGTPKTSAVSHSAGAFEFVYTSDLIEIAIETIVEIIW